MPPYGAETAARVLFDPTEKMIDYLVKKVSGAALIDLGDALDRGPMGVAVLCRFCGRQVAWFNRRQGLLLDNGGDATPAFHLHLRHEHYGELLHHDQVSR